MIHRLSPPLRSDTKTTRFPSGLNRGCTSIGMPLVKRVALPPSIGIVYRSPRRSKTIVLPSGLTSREIHEPLLVVKLTCRPTASGRSGFFFLLESGFCAPGACARPMTGAMAKTVARPAARIRRGVRIRGVLGSDVVAARSTRERGRSTGRRPPRGPQGRTRALGTPWPPKRPWRADASPFNPYPLLTELSGHSTTTQMTQISQMDADEKGESKPILRSFICVNLRHLVRQAKLHFSCELKGVHHVKCL